MKLRLLLSLSLLLALPAAFAETADDIFHGGAVNYLSNNIPKALDVVTNGRALFPDDIKLKKLEELLKQQNQQQQKDEQQKHDEQKDQQSKSDQKDDQKKDEGKSQKQADKREQEKKPDQQQSKQSDDKSKEKADEKQQQLAAHAMTPQEAKQLLDAQKGDEKVLQFMPQGESKKRERTLKDW
jgi:outer membrane biosynthesis protein TonB